jgi:hypothetical protein
MNIVDHARRLSREASETYPGSPLTSSAAGAAFTDTATMAKRRRERMFIAVEMWQEGEREFVLRVVFAFVVCGPRRDGTLNRTAVFV